MEEESDAEEIARISLDAYAALGSNGKPVSKPGRVEWTILAAFVLIDRSASSSSSSPSIQRQCIALGTGLKALPHARLPKHGDVLHDSHAEVIARRSLHLYLCTQISQALRGEKACLGRGESGRWTLREGVSIAMYISTLPCGDASMYLLSLQAPIVVSSLSSTKPSSSAAAASPSTMAATSLGLNTSRDYLPSASWNHSLDLEADNGDLATSTPPLVVLRGRNSYSNISLRTKPGRPDSIPTTSHSCSDKISLWNLLGIQGGLLSSLIERIPLEAIVIGGIDEKDRSKILVEAMRGLGGRLEGFDSRSKEFNLRIPIILFTDQVFVHSREWVFTGSGCVPVSCPDSLSFVAGEGVEVITNGIKKGAASKREDGMPLGIKSRSRVSKLSLLATYLAACCSDSSSTTYFAAKHSKESNADHNNYQVVKERVRGKEGPFDCWLVSGKGYENFDREGRVM